MKLEQMNKDELITFINELQEKYDDFKSRGLKLDMSRGKPSPEQTELSMPMLDLVSSQTPPFASDGTDIRNYSILDGIPEIKTLFASLLEVPAEQVSVDNNSSLGLMYDTVSRAMMFGVLGNTPWAKLPAVKFLCPSPGYDRHFAICELFGIEMITVSMLADGPDMDEVERLAASDDSIKGIWCVPKYSNPTGITYSDEVVRRFASLNPKAKDFRIFWDNSYCVHHINNTPDVLMNIYDALLKTGKEDMVYIFTSTSKVTFAGAGVSAMGASLKNIQSLRKFMSIRTIGSDKINHFRHAMFLKDKEGIDSHMKKHADIVRPKFECVLSVLDRELTGLGVASWTKPNGGYFISYDILPGCAKRVVSLCKEAGVVLTPAGATYPYGKDPDDQNIRIAPTYPSVEELTLAMELFCIASKFAAAEKLLEAK